MPISFKGASDSFGNCERQDDTTKEGVCLLELRHIGMVQWGVCRQVEPIDEHRENNPQLPASIIKEQKEDEEAMSEELLSELQKRKRVALRQCSESRSTRQSLKRKTSMSSKCKKIKHENSRAVKKENFNERWSLARYKLAEKSMLEVMKAEGAVFENPISRSALRIAARKLIGDTGLLDHLLKHIDGKVAPGGAERFRRCYNTDGTMEYWLESADMVKIKHEAGMPAPWWKPSNIAFRDSACSGEFSLLKEEIMKMKRNMEELISKNEKDQDNPMGEMYMELMKWRGKIDLRLMEISSSLSGVQDMYRELVAWKSKTEQQLADISTSLSSMQASRQCTTFSPTSEIWEDWLENTNWDNIHGDDFGSWLGITDLANVRKDGCVQEAYTTSQSWLRSCDVRSQDPVCAGEVGLLKEEMTKMKRDMKELLSKRMEEDQTSMTPDSSATTNSKLELDNALLLFQEMFKELVKWKAKMEQQLLEISNSVSTLRAPKQFTP